MSMSMSMMMNAYVPPVTYATWNPLDKSSNVTLSGGNLTISGGGGGVRSTVGVSSGKWYWEQTITVGGAGFVAGISRSFPDIATIPGHDINGWGIYQVGGLNPVPGFASLHYNSHNTFFPGGAYSQGDVISILLDVTNGSLEMWQNGTSRGVAFASGITGTIYVNGWVGGADIYTANFGASPFVYSVPVGYNSGLYA